MFRKGERFVENCDRFGRLPESLCKLWWTSIHVPLNVSLFKHCHVYLSSFRFLHIFVILSKIIFPHVFWCFICDFFFKFQLSKLKVVFILLSTPSVFFQLHFCFANYLSEITLEFIIESLSLCHKITNLIIASLLRLINCCAPQMVLSWLLHQSHQHMLFLAHLFSGWYVITLWEIGGNQHNA